MNKRLILGSPIDELLDRLYAKSAGQSQELTSYFSAWAEEPSFNSDRRFDARTNQFLSDKLVAIDRDKGEFCYQICRALGARRIVEAGTSFGVSTLFLAAAVRDNRRQNCGDGVVIGTEYEPQKARMARATFAEASLSEFIDLREGDIRDTLVDMAFPVDFMLVDIWAPMARPALEMVAPRLRTGAVVICDNTEQFREAYREYFEFVDDPANHFRTMTLPFEGGLEFTVRTD
jgi:predicted O-methyltransferase YrrM